MRRLPEVIADPGDDCWYTPRQAEVEEGPAVSIENLTDLVRASAAVATGVVTGIQGGVHDFSGPGLLIQVKVRRWLKTEPNYPHADIVHFFYPRGNFLIGNVRICTQAPGFPEPPAIDSEILLFPRWLDEDPAYLPVPPGLVAFDTADGLRAPDRLRELQAFRMADFKELQALVRREARQLRQGAER